MLAGLLQRARALPDSATLTTQLTQPLPPLLPPPCLPPTTQVLLPQLATRCAYLKPSTLAALLRDPAGALVPRLLSLRELLPGCDIGAAAAAEPELLLLRSLGEVQADVVRLQELLGPGADLAELVQRQPRFLDAECVGEVLEELRRLMPGKDAAQMLLADPSW